MVCCVYALENKYAYYFKMHKVTSFLSSPFLLHCRVKVQKSVKNTRAI